MDIEELEVGTVGLDYVLAGGDAGFYVEGLLLGDCGEGWEEPVLQLLEVVQF